MKAHHSISCSFLALLFLGALLLCMTPAVSSAQEQPQVQSQADSAKSPSGRCNVVLVEELNKRIGGWVCVTINSGITYCGIVMKERDGLVHLAKVQNKEYSDALIRVADISSLGVSRSQAK
jgi:hypothetical protein